MKLQQTSFILVSASVLSAASAHHIVASNAFVLDDDVAVEDLGLFSNDKESLVKRSPEILLANEPIDRDIPDRFNMQNVIAQIDTSSTENSDKNSDTSSAKNFDRNSEAPKRHMSVGRVWKLLTSLARGLSMDLRTFYDDFSNTFEDAWEDYYDLDKYEYSDEEIESIIAHREPELKHNDRFFISEHRMRDDNAKEIEDDYENDGYSSCRFYEALKDDGDDYYSENLKKEPEINSKKISSVLKHNSSFSMFNNYVNVAHPILDATDGDGEFSVVFVPSNDSIISLEKTISQKAIHDSREFKWIVRRVLWDFHHACHRKPVTDVEFMDIKFFAKRRLVQNFRLNMLRSHIVIMHPTAGETSSKSDVHTNIERLENGQLFILQTGSTGIISRKVGSGILTVNVINRGDTVYSANITEKIEGENGVIYVVDNFLGSPRLF